MDTQNKINDARPNIIWIFGDQHRAQALGCNENKMVKTPNIDKLAEKGVNFIKAVCGFPLCCPMRGSLLTSKYPHESVPGHEYRMPEEMPTIADAFNNEEFKTAYFGKWHVDGAHERWENAAKHYIPPERRGNFQTWIGYDNNNQPWNCWVHGHDEEGNEIEHYKLDGYETDKITDLFLDYLKKHINQSKNTPFFSVLSVQPPHNPYFGPEDKMEHYYEDEFLLQPKKFKLRKNVPLIPEIEKSARKDLASYYSMIEQIDVNVGRITRALREKGIYENTVIIFFSDHGDMHYSHGHTRKTTPHEESIRIPFIIGGGYVEKKLDGIRNKKSDAIINHVDIATTTLGIAKVQIPDGMMGFDYSPYIEKEVEKIENEPNSAYIQSNIPTGHHDCIDKPWRGIITKDGWKYVCFNGCDWMMYNLNEDEYELVNLAHYSRFEGKKKELKQNLNNWVKKAGDNFEIPENISRKQQLNQNEIDSILRRWGYQKAKMLLEDAKRGKGKIGEKEKDVIHLKKLLKEKKQLL